MTIAYSPEGRQLADLIARSLDLADRLELGHVGIDLNAALERLTGQGVPPRN